MNLDIQLSSDDELEAIKKKKLVELQKEAATKAMVHTLSEPIVLTDTNFASEVRKNPLMIVDFWAPWCGPCRMVSPIIEQLAREYSGKVTVGKVNVDENSDLAIKYDVTTIPRVLLFKGSDKPIQQIVGLTPEAELVKLLDKTLA